MTTIKVQEYNRLTVKERARLEVLGYTLDGKDVREIDLANAGILKAQALAYFNGSDILERAGKFERVQTELVLIAREAEDLAEMTLSSFELRKRIAEITRKYAIVYGDLVKLDSLVLHEFSYDV